jgi:hypothetical protein
MTNVVTFYHQITGPAFYEWPEDKDLTEYVEALNNSASGDPQQDLAAQLDPCYAAVVNEVVNELPDYTNHQESWTNPDIPVMWGTSAELKSFPMAWPLDVTQGDLEAWVEEVNEKYSDPKSVVVAARIEHDGEIVARWVGTE